MSRKHIYSMPSLQWAFGPATKLLETLHVIFRSFSHYQKLLYIGFVSLQTECRLWAMCYLCVLLGR